MTIEEALAAAKAIYPDVSVAHHTDMGHQFDPVFHTYFIHAWVGRTASFSVVEFSWEHALARFAKHFQEAASC